MPAPARPKSKRLSWQLDIQRHHPAIMTWRLADTFPAAVRACRQRALTLYAQAQESSQSPLSPTLPCKSMTRDDGGIVPPLSMPCIAVGSGELCPHRLAQNESEVIEFLIDLD